MRRLALLLLCSACNPTDDTGTNDPDVDPVDTALCEVLQTVSPDPIVASEDLGNAPTAYIHDEAKRIVLNGDEPPYSGYVRIDVGEDGIHAFGLSAVARVIVESNRTGLLEEDDGVPASGCDTIEHRVDYELLTGVAWPYIESVTPDITIATVVAESFETE